MNAKWERAAAISEAILNERIVNTLTLRATKINPTDQVTTYLLLDVTLSEDRYDRIREICREHGGRMIVLDNTDERGFNLRIWPRADH